MPGEDGTEWGFEPCGTGMRKGFGKRMGFSGGYGRKNWFYATTTDSTSQ